MFALNRSSHFGSPLPQVVQKALGQPGLANTLELLKRCPLHRPTPLRSLPMLAEAMGIGALYVKDESFRFGLGSFKSLGGAYAVLRLLMEVASHRLGYQISASELRKPEVLEIAKSITVGCATDGNHGRSVAAGAQFLGIRAVIFVHSGVSEARVGAMMKLDAEIIRVEGTYDDSVAEALAVCQREGWNVISDTSWPGYDEVPLRVMQGYTAMVDEALKVMSVPPTHVFLQAGVGGFAASVSAFLKDRLGGDGPKIIVVEPQRAACLFESMIADAPSRVERHEPTVMAMLECYEPSLIAWGILSRLADAFMTVDEEDAIDAMKRLAEPLGDDPSIVAGESGGVGLSGLTVVLREPEVMRQLGLNAKSRVLLFNTEGATDPELYEQIVGRSADSALEQRDTGA